MKKYTSAFALMAGCAFVSAQDGTVTVTATRDTRPVQKAPYYASQISAEDLTSRHAPRTVPEALQNETGISIQKTGHGQGSPYIRGFTGYRNLMMIDGIRLNNSTFRDGPNQYWNTVDALGLHQIDVVRGPFSALYGSDAIGGTAECTTRGAQDLPAGKTHLNNFYYRYASAEDSHQARLGTIFKVADSTVVSAGLTAKDFGDLKGGKDVGTQKKTGYTEQDWDAKVEHFTDDDSHIVVAHQQVNIDDAWRTHSTIYGISWEGTSVGKDLKHSLDQDRQLTYAQYHQINIGETIDEVHAGISHHMQAEERDRIRTGDRYDNQGTDINTIGAFLQLKSLSRIGDLVYGLDYYHDNVDSFNDTLKPDGTIKKSSIQGPVADEATYSTAAAFVQDIISLDQNSSLLIGARYEHSAADADKVEDPTTGKQISISDGWDTLVGNVRIIKGLTQDGSAKIFAGISQGFRAPNLSDLTRLDSARTDEIEIPSPGLEPEKYISYELGAKLSTENATAQIALFHTDIRDTIDRTPTGEIIDGDRAVEKKNVGDGYSQGVEVEADYKLTHTVDLFASATWVYGEVDAYPTSEPVMATEPISKLMPPEAHAGIRWRPTDKVWTELSCNAAADADKLSTSDKSDTSRIPPGGTPGYAVYHLRTSWQPTEYATISMAVENLTDEDYRVHGSGLNEPGRNLVLATQLQF